MESVDKIKKMIDSLEKDIADMTDKTKTKEELQELNIKLRTNYTLSLMKTTTHDEVIELLLEIGSAVYVAGMPNTPKDSSVALLTTAFVKFEDFLREHCERLVEDVCK